LTLSLPKERFNSWPLKEKPRRGCTRVVFISVERLIT